MNEWMNGWLKGPFVATKCKSRCLKQRATDNQLQSRHRSFARFPLCKSVITKQQKNGPISISEFSARCQTHQNGGQWIPIAQSRIILFLSRCQWQQINTCPTFWCFNASFIRLFHFRYGWTEEFQFRRQADDIILVREDPRRGARAVETDPVTSTVA